MSILKAALLRVLFEGAEVREPYIDLVKSLIDEECHCSDAYQFYDGEMRREGTVYLFGTKEVYWLEAEGSKPRLLIIRDADLRETILDLLAVHPLYAKWFG